MYSFNAKIVFFNCPDNFINSIKSFSPLPAFSQEFIVRSRLSAEDLSTATLILMGSLPENLDIFENKGSDTELVALLGANNGLPEPVVKFFDDIWIEPLSEQRIGFYFKKWQERLKSKKDAWQTELFLEMVLDTSPNLIWFKNKNGIHELVNRSFCNTVEKSREDVQGKGHAYIWNVPQDDPVCIESERIVMETGKTHSREEEIETGNGRRLLTTYKSPLRNIDGSMMGTMGIGVDITQERLYQEQLIRNNATLETIFTTMDCGVLCHSLDGKRVISVNRAALRLLDHNSREDLEDNGFEMVASTVLDEDKPRMIEAIGQLKNVGDSASFEYRVRHSSGRILHIMGSAKLVEKDGEIFCQRFLLDCTEQKMAEKMEQNRLEKRQKELIRALAIDYQLVFVLDLHSRKGTVLQLRKDPDPHLYNIFSTGTDLEGGLNKYIESRVHPDDREAFARACSIPVLQKELSRKKIHYCHYRVLDGDDVLYFQMKAVRAGTQQEEFGVIMGLQSVNARTRYEMEQKARLAEALKQAKKASTAKSIFLSNMSHDIRTPMNAVVGYTSLALAQLDNRANVQAYLEKILTSGKHLISLINDILDMSHIESGKIQLEEKLCDLPQLLQELWNIVQPTAQAKKHEVIFNFDKIRNKEIFCDRLRVNQILLNLVSNSIKYTPDGGKISLDVHQLPCAGSSQAVFEFHIQDNGIGMSEEFLGKIFDPFERAQSTTVAGIEGTGLGMAITKNIVNMMQGDIEVYSKLGNGTEFVFRVAFEVPQALSQAMEDLSPRSDKKQGGIQKARQVGRILLTEDNAMNQEIACEFLRGAGYEVVVASNGQESVNTLQEYGPGYFDVILMDVQMPVLDGYGATELIRALPDQQLASIPIIAMTANSFEEDRQEAMRRGMNGHIAKPIDFQILFETLDKLLGDKANSTVDTRSPMLAASSHTICHGTEPPLS